MKVALYARVSTNDQDESLQLPRLRDYAGRAGWDVVGEYSDTATGKNCDRPGWLAMMSDARARAFDRILVTKLDRMMRSIRILLDELEQLTAYEVQVFALDIGLLDMKSPGSRLLLTVLGSIAEWEGEIISLRTKEALAQRKARGEKLGRPAADIPLHQVALLRLTGRTWKDISLQTGVNVSTLRNHINAIEKEMEAIRNDVLWEIEPRELAGLDMSKVI